MANYEISPACVTCELKICTLLDHAWFIQRYESINASYQVTAKWGNGGRTSWRYCLSPAPAIRRIAAHLTPAAIPARLHSSLLPRTCRQVQLSFTSNHKVKHPIFTRNHIPAATSQALHFRSTPSFHPGDQLHYLQALTAANNIY